MLAVFYATDTFGEITIITDERTDGRTRPVAILFPLMRSVGKAQVT